MTNIIKTSDKEEYILKQSGELQQSGLNILEVLVTASLNSLKQYNGHNRMGHADYQVFKRNNCGGGLVVSVNMSNGGLVKYDYRCKDHRQCKRCNDWRREIAKTRLELSEEKLVAVHIVGDGTKQARDVGGAKNYIRVPAPDGEIMLVTPESAEKLRSKKGGENLTIMEMDNEVRESVATLMANVLEGRRVSGKLLGKVGLYQMPVKKNEPMMPETQLLEKHTLTIPRYLIPQGTTLTQQTFDEISERVEKAYYNAMKWVTWKNQKSVDNFTLFIDTKMAEALKEIIGFDAFVRLPPKKGTISIVSEEVNISSLDDTIPF